MCACVVRACVGVGARALACAFARISEYEIRVLIFLRLLYKYFKTNLAGNSHKREKFLHVKYPFFLSGFNETNFLDGFSKKIFKYEIP